MHLVQGVFQFCLLRVLARLLEQDVTIPDISDLLFKVAHNCEEREMLNLSILLGEQLGTLAALAGVLCDGVVVDELPTSLEKKSSMENERNAVSHELSVKLVQKSGMTWESTLSSEATKPESLLKAVRTRALYFRWT